MIATENTDPRWRNAPVSLKPEHVADPHLVLEWFFYPGGGLPRYRKKLKKWLLAAIDDQHQWTRNKLVRCIYAFNDMARLLEALWIIDQQHCSFNEDEVGLRYEGIDDRVIWSSQVNDQLRWYGYDEAAYHPEFLSEEEERAPYSVIKEFFQGHDLFDARQKLDAWCHTAIANSWEYRLMSRQELVAIYEQMNKVIEAVFIIAEIRFLKKEKGVDPG